MKLEKELLSLLNHSITKLMARPHIIEGEELYIGVDDCPKDVSWTEYECHNGEVCLNFTYGNGVAVSEDNRFIMVYPTRSSLHPDDKAYMREYQGIDAPRSYTNRDCALCFGSRLYHNPLYKKAK